MPRREPEAKVKLELEIKSRDFSSKKRDWLTYGTSHKSWEIVFYSVTVDPLASGLASYFICKSHLIGNSHIPSFSRTFTIWEKKSE